MTEHSLLAALSGVRLHLFHPDSQSSRAFCAALRQLGCDVRQSWPPSVKIPANCQLVAAAVEPQYQAALKSLFRQLREQHIPALALAESHHPQLFSLLLELQPSAIAERELNPFALMVQIVALLRTARQHQQLRERLQNHQPLTGRGDRLAQAKGVLMQTYGLDEPGAYRFMRREAMNTRSSLEFTAERVINSLQK